LYDNTIDRPIGRDLIGAKRRRISAQHDLFSEPVSTFPDHALMAGDAETPKAAKGNMSSELLGDLIGRSVSRVEDARLLRGQARFIDDIVLPDMLHASKAPVPPRPRRCPACMPSYYMRICDRF
jgi:hypothetical protein